MMPVCNAITTTKHRQISAAVPTAAIRVARWTVCFLVLSVFLAQQAVGQVSNSSQAREARLRDSLISAGNGVSSLQARIRSAREKLDELTKNVQAIKPQPPSEEQPPEEKGVQELQVPLPEQGETRKTYKLFICVDRKLFFADYDAINRAYVGIEKPAIAKLKNGTGRIGERLAGTASVAAGDYTMKYSLKYLEVDLGFVKSRAWDGDIAPDSTRKPKPFGKLLQKPTAVGETIDEIQKPDSVFQKQLSATTPENSIILLAVYPDSAKIFRKAREIAWTGQTKFVVRPLFIPAGKVLEFKPAEIPSDFYLLSP